MAITPPRDGEEQAASGSCVRIFGVGGRTYVRDDEGESVLASIVSPTDTPEIPVGSPVHLEQASPSLWRVVDGAGMIIGHLHSFVRSGGVRYQARRFHPASSRFRDLGEFWTVRDALECLRYSR